MTSWTDKDGHIDGARHVNTELTTRECWNLLTTDTTGRFSYQAGGRILIFPVNYLIHDEAIFFRTLPEGAIGSALPCAVASFEIDMVKREQSTGWAVLASGPASAVTDQDLLTYLWGRIMLEPLAAGLRDQFVRLDPAELTGRRVYLS